MRRAAAPLGARTAGSAPPTLLIVGGADPVVLELTGEAARRMRSAPVELVVVPGATHLFDEPGTLANVARLAQDWFVRHA